MKITVVQPPYFMGDRPDESIAESLINEMKNASSGALIVLPEYSNAGGFSDAEREIKALPRAERMKKEASIVAKEKSAYVAINVLEERSGDFMNSTYLFDKNGEAAFIYDKSHLPPSEVALGAITNVASAALLNPKMKERVVIERQRQIHVFQNCSHKNSRL